MQEPTDYDDLPLNAHNAEANNINEFPDAEEPAEEVFTLIPGQILQQCQTKNITQRRKAFDAIQALANEQEDLSACHEIAPELHVLLKESNAIIQEKVLAITELLVDAGAIPNQQVLAKSLCENALGTPKQAIRDLNLRIMRKLAHSGLRTVTDSLLKQFSAKQVKQAVEAAQILADLLTQPDPGRDMGAQFVMEYVRQLVPGLSHKEQAIRRCCTEILVRFCGYAARQQILEELQAGGLPKVNLQAVEEALGAATQESEQMADQLVASAHEQVDKLIKFYAPAADKAALVLPRNFYDQLGASAWKTKKEALQQLLDQLQACGQCSFGSDYQNLVTTLKIMLMQELNVYNVGLVYRVLAQLSIKIGLLGNNPKQLFQQAIHRVKERKYAVISGFEIFSQSLMVRAYNVKDFIFEYLATSIPHKNPEVKEDFCRFLKVVYATSLAFNSKIANARDRAAENQLVKQISNDYYPNCQYLNTDEVIPEEGEKSYGMELNSRVERQMSCSNSIFATFFVNGEVNLQPVVYEQEIISFVQQVDRLLNDVQDSIRELSKRMFCLFVMAHIAEAHDCVQRSDGAQAVVSAYEQLYSLMFDVVHEHKRKTEFVQLITLYAADCQMAELFTGILNSNGFALGGGAVAEQGVGQAPGDTAEPMDQQPFQEEMAPEMEERCEAAENIQEPPHLQIRGKQGQQPVNGYNQRAATQIKFTLDPNNQGSPVSRNCYEELYNQISQEFGTSVAQRMFIKNINPLYSAVPAIGTSKTLQEMVRQIIDTLNSSSQYVASRDLLLRYANVLLCDGVVSKSQPSPTTIKLALELISAVVGCCAANGTRLSAYDIECGGLVLLGRLEEFVSPQLREQIIQTAELLYAHCESPVDFLQFIIDNLIGKNVRYLIRQVPTRVGITRFALAIAVDCYRKGVAMDRLGTTTTSNLVSQYQSFGIEVFQLTECGLTAAIPFRLSSAREMVAALAAVIAELSQHTDGGRRLEEAILRNFRDEVQLIEIVGEELHRLRASPQEEYSEEGGSVATYEPFQMGTAQFVPVQAPPPYETPYGPTGCMTYGPPLNAGALAPEPQPVETSPAMAHVTALNQEPIRPTIVTYQPFRTPVRSTAEPQRSRKSVRFAEDDVLVQNDVESVENLPDRLIDTSRLDFSVATTIVSNSQLAGSQNPLLSTQESNQIEAGLLGELFEQFTTGTIVRHTNLFKQLIGYMREPRSNRAYHLMSETAQIARQISSILRFYLNGSVYQALCSRIVEDHSYTAHLCKLSKYYYLLVSQLFVNEETLVNQENIIRTAIEDLIFSSVLAEQLDDASKAELLGVNEGALNTIISVCNIEKVFCALIQILSEFNIARIGGRHVPQKNHIQYYILTNIDGYMFELCDDYLISIVRKTVDALYTEFDVVLTFRVNEANKMFDNSDLNTPQNTILKGRWRELEHNFPEFTKQLSANVPSYFENVFFHLHLFLLKEKDTNYKRQFNGDIEYKIINDIVKGFRQEAGDGIYLFLQKVPNVEGVELRGLIE